MKERIVITSKTEEAIGFGPILTKLRDVVIYVSTMEQREEMAKVFWKSLSLEELAIIEENPEAAVVVTLGLKCIFMTDDPTTLEADFDDETISEEASSVVVTAALEGLLRRDLIVTNGFYFYNPFEKNSKAMFTAKEKAHLLNMPETQDEKLDRML